MHSLQREILGSWYTVDNYNSLGSSLDNYITIYYLTSKASGFSNKLMDMAEAVKKSSVQNTKYFFANGKITPAAGAYYTINLKSNDMSSSRLNNNLKMGGAKLQMRK